MAGNTAGTLTSPVINGTYHCKFANGEVRVLIVSGGACMWSGAISATVAVTTAEVYEVMAVTAGMGTGSWTVSRGQEGTTALDSIPLGTSILYLPAFHRRGADINGSPGAADILGGAPIITPPGTGTNTPEAKITQRFDLLSPVYLTQGYRLGKYGAYLTADVASSGTAALAVNSTAQFPQSGNFMINTGWGEDILVNVANATHLNVVARAQNGTMASAVSGTATGLSIIQQVDFAQTGGSAAYISAGGLNSGNYYIAMAPQMSPLREYAAFQPMTMSFLFDGQAFAMAAQGPISLLMIVDGKVVHAPNDFVESPGLGAGIYWHRINFGSRRTRRIQLITFCMPMALAYLPQDTLLPWDRSGDPTFSYDSDSYGGVESHTWQDLMYGGGLGLYLEAALAMNLPNIDFGIPVGGAGYIGQPAAAPPAFPRPKYSAINRLLGLSHMAPPGVFFGGNGHNDGSSSTPAGIVNGGQGTVANGVLGTLTLNSNAGYPSTATAGTFIISVESELMLVTNNATTSWTVQRGYGGTTPVAHTAAAVSACTPQMFTDIAIYWTTLRAVWPETVLLASHFWHQGFEAGASAYLRACLASPILRALSLAGGPWVFLDTILGTWQNSQGSTGRITGLGRPVITGTGYAAAPGYPGGHTTGDGNADYMISDGVHPSNRGAKYLGDVIATAARTAVLAL